MKPKIKHDWYQTESQVVITVLLKNAPKDKVKVDFGERSVSIFLLPLSIIVHTCLSRPDQKCTSLDPRRGWMRKAED